MFIQVLMITTKIIVFDYMIGKHMLGNKNVKLQLLNYIEN